MLVLDAVDAVLPPAEVASSEWLPTHITMPQGTETAGQPFSFAMFPHIEGVCEAFDNPRVRVIVLQFGTRLGKTTTGLSLAVKTAATRPRNMMVNGPTKDAIGRVIDSRFYPLLESCEATRGELPPSGRRNTFEVELALCRVIVGWSGSASSLADVGAWYLLNIEIDKWDRAASDEADPLSLSLNRVKGFLGSKVLLESTPTIKGRSRIERWMARSNQHRRWVPCPHCGEFQVLRKGGRDTKGGIKWDSDSNGHSTPEVAMATAYYECEHCAGRIEDHHRLQMLRAGVWVPDGCRVKPTGAIVGRANREGNDTVGFGPLPSWYSLLERWGNFARRWVDAQGKPRELQDVVNSDMAETWEERRQEQDWETVARRLIGESPAGVVPAGHSLVTVGIDKQKDHYVYAVRSWGEGRVSTVIDYGTTDTLQQVQAGVIARAWPHADGGAAVVAAATLVDSGYDPNEPGAGNVYEFCRRQSRPGRVILACKGASRPLNTSYKISTLGKDTGSPGQRLVTIDVQTSQGLMEQQLYVLRAGDPGFLEIAAGSPESHQDLIVQLMNEARDEARGTWDRIDAGVPNDYRDCARMAEVAMLIATRGGRIRPRVAQGEEATDKPKPRPKPRQVQFLERPGGWAREFRT